jgi:decaprenylphospho-beta-D-erythro-pentofuranosid-2-ulose 2-reductase
MHRSAPAKQTRVLIIGATSAIATATARRMAARGYSLYLMARNRERLEAVASDLRLRGATRVELDVVGLTDASSHPTVLSKAAETMGGIDIALIAYGILGDQKRAEENYEAAAEIMETNFNSVVSLLTWIGNYFEKRAAGTIAVISSVAGDRGRRSNYAYGASKAALNVFLDGMRGRFNGTGVRVLTIKPGFVSTPMTAHLKQNALFAQPDTIALGILRAIDRRREEVYLPWFWAPIMFAVRCIPRPLFKKLNL